MIPSKSPDDRVIPPKDWQKYDGCPACRLFRRAAEKGKEISLSQIESAFSRAESESVG